MERVIEQTCCFFGHRNINKTDELKLKLYNEIENLVAKENINIFLFGSKSEFDDLCYKTVSALMKKYPYIKRIYVRAEFSYIDDSYKEYLLKSYEDTYYPSKIVGAGKAAYVERNQEMIDNSDYCICYYDEEYLPPRRKSGKRGVTYSGCAIAYDYALKNKKRIINVFSGVK